MVNWKSRMLGDVLVFANGLVMVLMINLVVSHYFFRIDLTEERRYSLKDQTKSILQNVDDDVYVEIYLEGDLNPDFKRFQKSITETLEEFRIYSNNKVRYVVTDPNLAMSQKAQSEFMTDLANRGIQPMNVIGQKDGKRIEQIVFPGVIVSYGGLETGVMLLKGNKASEINQSVEGIEYELANAIYKLTSTDQKQIGFVSGHGELESLSIAAFQQDLQELYAVSKINLQDRESLKAQDALIIAKPTQTFSQSDKYNLDQYIMQGGKVLFLIDKMNASMDSASQEDYFVLPYDLNIDDLLFKYGVRINPDLIQDRSSSFYPIVTGQTQGKPNMQLIEWPFFPLINHYADHPITRNLDAISTKFISSIDTVKAEGVKKTPLMMTSEFTRKVTAPVSVNVNQLRKELKPQDYTLSSIPVGYLLEGKFSSLFKNRFLPEGADQSSSIGDGKETKLIVLGDGDIIRNDVNPRTRKAQPLGFDPFTNYTFANREFLMNALAYLTDEGGLIQARNKEIKIRPLNKEKVNAEKLKWQIINVALPILLLVMYGVARAYWRKRKFAQY
ncbi:MAG TPA: gliding motility-associated ABC transporter substrate-binding protein GldG [Chryseolinea sp.]|nr:gliding motility-associated ABC transporter substrate-binding protein GldG [Chryseolinea sp.]HPM30449.1 gliding motility-associated ABC transporter substrate-binding protein GldG [Chryseolinea sp.]